MTNPCLRPASLGDVKHLCEAFKSLGPAFARTHAMFSCALEDLYNAEWKLRGVERSP